MAEPDNYQWSHIGLCVSDLERSMRFYCEGLACVPAERFELDSTLVAGLAESLEVEGTAVVVSQMVTRGPLRIELLGWSSPAATGLPALRRNQLGLTHLSFFVDNVDEASSRLLGFGGALLPKTRQSPGIDLVFLADPDGTRIELMARSRSS